MIFLKKFTYRLPICETFETKFRKLRTTISFYQQTLFQSTKKVLSAFHCIVKEDEKKVDGCGRTLLPGGTFWQGTTDASVALYPEDGEMPERRVFVKSFEIDICEVTCAAFFFHQKIEECLFLKNMSRNANMGPDPMRDVRKY